MLQCIKNPHVYLLSHACSKKTCEILAIVISTIIIGLCLISCAGTPAEPVSYVKPPSTGGEVAVAKTLETMITAYNDQDTDRHLSCFAPDARIDSKHAGEVVSKVGYQKILKKSSKFVTLRLKNTKFTEISPIKYKVEAILSGNDSVDISYELIPFGGRWVILELRYQ
jgi:hypothetical protein